MLDLSDLDGFNLSALLQTPRRASVELSLELIDFDPTQPRKHFDPASIERLAQTICAYGVIQPISVHKHPAVPGRFIVNVGERRVRASRLARLKTIPAIVEAPLDGYARVIENLAREDLSPFEVAQFFAEREEAGELRTEIARRLGKSASFVTEISRLARAPQPVRRIWESGRCGDVRTLYGLCRAYAANATAIEALVDSDEPINREYLESLNVVAPVKSEIKSQHVLSTSKPAPDRSVRKSANAFLVEVAGRLAFLSLAARESMTAAQVVFADGSRETVELGRIRLIQWTTLP